MSCKIQKNLVRLANDLSNLEAILLELLQNKILSQDETDEIRSEKTPLQRNSKLLSTLRRKQWNRIENVFLKILRRTGNNHCADLIQGITNQGVHPKHEKHPKLSKWWPDDRLLIKSLHKRKINGKFLVEELHEKLSKDRNRMVVICESDQFKVSGLGGVGKTLTANWYAHNYENKYGQIIWIDCGDGRLPYSFKKLGRDLDLKNFNKFLDLDDLVTNIYKDLKEWNCLWVYDNAECYQGDGGIQKFLPKNKDNFYCLITSRSRDWGTEEGYGKISALQLNVFSEKESLDFFQETLGTELEYTESQLRELCRLLGYLPLAMQLAVAALKSNKIDLENYIRKTSSKDLENIVDRQFDDYEKTINKNVSISMDLILKEKYGHEAKEILIVFGYIQPDDVQSKFLLEVTNLGLHVLEGALELLQKYSFINTTGKVEETVNSEGLVNRFFGWREMRNMPLLSIHRLLQQVIRHNGQNTEKETLRKILNVHGFLDYKLVPFTKHADKELRKQFPKVKAQLLDHEQLKKFFKEERFEESVQLARFIDEEIDTITTKFNLVVCLEKVREYENAIKCIQKFAKVEKSENAGGAVNTPMEILIKHITENNVKIKIEEYLRIMELNRDPTEVDIKNVLLHLYLRTEKNEAGLEVVKQNGTSSEIVRILSLFHIPKYSLEIDEEQISLEFEEEVKKIKLEKCSVDSYVQFPSDLHDLSINNVEFRNGNEEWTNILSWNDRLPKNLNKLTIILDNCSELLLVPLNVISSIEYLTLKGVSLDLTSGGRLFSRELYLEEVLFTDNGHELTKVEVNEFASFDRINKLSIIYKTSNAISIDIFDQVRIQYLKLSNIKVVNWRDSKWSVEELILCDIPLKEKTKMNIAELKMKRSSLNITFLPQTVKKLTLNSTTIIKVRSLKINLPNLKYLQLKHMDGACLAAFYSVQLTHIQFNWIRKINVDFFPKSIQAIKITQDTELVGGARQVEKLILDAFLMNKIHTIFKQIQPKSLVLFENLIKPAELTKLIKRGIEKIAIGKVNWKKEVFYTSELRNYVDHQSEFYVVEKGKGKTIKEVQFEELRKLQ